MLEGVLIPAIIGEIRSLKDGSVKISLETQEVAPAKAGELFALRNKIAYCYISERQATSQERGIIDKLDPELRGKTPGQRLRNVLYICWQQNNEGYKDSESYYAAKMELIINTYKANLNP